MDNENLDGQTVVGGVVTATMKTADVKLKLTEYLAYGLGNGGEIFMFTFALSYMNIYWTDGLMLPIGMVGIFMLICKIWDAINDPIIGSIADKTVSRWGRYRPWIIFSFVPMSIFGMGMFWKLPGDNVTSQMIFTFSMYFMWTIAFTCIEVPHVSLMSTMTTNYNARGVLASFRQVTASVFMFLISITFIPMASYFGGEAGPNAGYPATVRVFMAISVPFYFICFFGVKERVKFVKLDADAGEKPPSFWENLKCMKGNWPALTLCLADLMQGLMSGLTSGTKIFYWTYVQENMAHFVFNSGIRTAALIVAGLTFATFVRKINNKRNLGMFFWAASVIFFLIMYFGVPKSSPGGLVLFDTMTVITSLCTQVGSVCIFSLAPDVTEYTQKKYGLRASGFIFAFINLMYQFGIAAGQAIFNNVLAANNYVPNTPQPENIKVIMFTFITLVPAVLMAIGAFAFFSFKINRASHETTLDELV